MSAGVAAKASTGPGRAQRKKGDERAAPARPQSGRYTKPIPKSVRRSARWFGPAVLLLLVGGVLAIVLNYLTVLPGAVSVWYLVGGIIALFGGFLMATHYR